MSNSHGLEWGCNYDVKVYTEMVYPLLMDALPL
jgi:hypothetical protein